MSETMAVSEAARRYLASLSPEERVQQQSDLMRFTQWLRGDQAVAEITPLQVETYQATLESTGADTNKRLMPVKTFLGWVDEKGLAPTRLAKYVKLKRTAGPRRPFSTRRRSTRTPRSRRAPLNSAARSRPCTRRTLSTLQSRGR